MADENKNLHEGHRKRIRARFLEEGLDNFNQHQILELLLFHTIPRKDTNEIAHNLINTFGSISNVFDAHPADLMKVSSMTENSSILLSMIPQLARVYYNDLTRERLKIVNPASAMEYIETFFVGRLYEVFYLFCMDNSGRIIHEEQICEGTLDETPYYPRLILESAFRHKAQKVIFAHNHPSDILNPSQNDIETTHRLVTLFESVNIEVCDHIIVGRSGYVSMKEIGCLRK